MGISDVELRKMKETVDVLAGVRGSRSQFAVRQADLDRVSVVPADFSQNADRIAEAIASEVNTEISNLKSRDGQHDERLNALDARFEKQKSAAEAAPSQALTSVEATSSITIANFNALRTDVANLKASVDALKALLSA